MQMIESVRVTPRSPFSGKQITTIMNICNEHGDEIVHEGRRCPACDQAADLSGKIEELKEKITELEQEIETLKDAQ